MITLHTVQELSADLMEIRARLVAKLYSGKIDKATKDFVLGQLQMNGEIQSKVQTIILGAQEQ